MVGIPFHNAFNIALAVISHINILTYSSVLQNTGIGQTTDIIVDIVDKVQRLG
jgi:hypothetical protein